MSEAIGAGALQSRLVEVPVTSGVEPSISAGVPREASFGVRNLNRFVLYELVSLRTEMLFHIVFDPIETEE